MSISEQTTMMINRVQHIRNKFHPQANMDDGLYLSYGPATGGIKGGVKKIMELLKIPNLHSIETKLNKEGGIDISRINFKPSNKEEIKTRKSTIKFGS